MNFKLIEKGATRYLIPTMLFSTAVVSGAIPANAASAPQEKVETKSGTLTGTVIDSTGEPVIGATVMVKGTANGTATDIDGNFTLNNVKGDVVVISYIGCKPKEVNIKGKSHIDVTLEDDSAVLGEVVVVGYGTQKKATMTGAVTAVGGDQMESKGSLSSPVQALQGQVPGVIITRGSSAPGDESWSMSLRGAVSKNSTEPLVIIDGVEYEGVGALSGINPSDIESMNFLKDAAASIYGSKAAGGVVLITTKKANDINTKVTYSGSFTAKFKGLSPTLLNMKDWATYNIMSLENDNNRNHFWQYSKLALEYLDRYIDFNYNKRPVPNFDAVSEFVFFNTDWDDIMWGDSWSTQHELAVSGGKQGATFRLSLGYMHDDSNLRWGNNSNNRYNFRLTNSFDLAKNLSLQSIVAYNRKDQVAPSQLNKALSTTIQQPGFPSATIDGKPYAWGDWVTPNWMCELGGDNKLKTSEININESLRYEIIPGLRLNAVAGYNTSTASRDIKMKPVTFYNYTGTETVYTYPLQSASSYTKSNARTDFYSLQAYLDWEHIFREDHEVKVMGGVQYNYKNYEYTPVTATNITPSLDVINGSGTITLANGSQTVTNWEEAIMSYYGRANYNYQSKYLLEAQARYDGSSKFQPKNRWAFFWGASLGWRVLQENFMEGVREWWDEFKIRGSYGNVGNQSGIDRYSGVALYDYYQGSGAFVDGEKLSYITTNGKLVSTDRTWERVHNYNIGVDLAFFNSRLTGSFDAFWKRTNNMLIGVTYPAILGDQAPTANLGKFKAWGYEGMINWRDKIGNVQYHVGGTFTYADNKLLDNGGSGAIQAGVRSDREGYPLNSVFGLRYCGKIQNEEQLQKYINRYGTNSNVSGNINMLRLGDNMFEDINGDGALTEEDLVYLGTDDPKIQFSFNGGVEWNGFDLGVVFQGAAKRTVWRSQANGQMDPWNVPMRTAYQNSTNQFIGKLWSVDNPDGFYPTLTAQNNINNYNYQCSSWSVHDGSYIRLKNITLGYSLPQSVLEKTHCISNLRVYVTGTDLWEWCKIHDGWDPEAKRTVSTTGRYPFVRNLTFGLNVTF